MSHDSSPPPPPARRPLLRLLVCLLTHTLYRLRIVNAHKVPDTGGALLIPNHVSFIDGLFIMAAIRRPVRFLVDADYCEHPLLRPFMRSIGAIPLPSSAGPRDLLNAMRTAGKCLDAGEVVCIFGEGQITRTGMLLPFRRGMERIVKGHQAPIIPVFLDRVWGSIFSRSGGRFFFKIPRRIPYPITVAFGGPLPTGSSLHAIRQAVQELTVEAAEQSKADRRPLHHTFVRSSRWRPLKFLYADHTGRTMRRLPAVAGAVALARALRRRWVDQPHVGVLLPPTIPAALTNVAAALAGRTVVNLNYTAGTDSTASAIRQASLKSVVTSRAFLGKIELELPDTVESIILEDLRPEIGRLARLSALLLAMFMPVRWLERCCGATAPVDIDDLATIIFSSGSTGEPKGVMLSHYNLTVNLAGVSQVCRVEPTDRMLGILPMFHSFGFLAMWFVNNCNMGIAFCPNPVDAPLVGHTVQRYGLTFLIATPTFLQIYARRCTPAQFGSLRLVIAGAEKLSPRVSQAFEDTFGVRPLEGYGTTECSPVISASVPDFRAPGFFQPGSRRGTVGQPIPGVAVRIVDPDTYDPVPLDKPGMLLATGPNVMQGYVGRPDLTQEVMRDGWYVTGDIAAMDEDGFITITDRLARFSKIGGEMVPHGRIEQALHDAAEVDEQIFAVTGVPDARKGEAIVVLHITDDATVDTVLERVTAEGLPNLFIPRRDRFLKVDALPLLGTGKLDLRQIKTLAREAFKAQGDA